MGPHEKLPVHVRLQLARLMLLFFSPMTDQAKLDHGFQVKSANGAIVPSSLVDFLEYVAKDRSIIANPHEVTFQIATLAARLESAGFLVKMQGATMPPPFGNEYYAIHSGFTAGQAAGSLGLAEALGPEFLIRSFLPCTVAITGKDNDGGVHIGTGLLINDRHILTNRHVVTDMTVDEVLYTSTDAGADSADKTVDAIELTMTGQKAHEAVNGSGEDVDVAIIEVTGLEGRYAYGGGIAFRDAEWSDRVWTFGYPTVPMTKESAVVVHGGEVVRPQVQGYFGNDVVLFSAVARPGNSGGPIVAQDGRVVGIVAEELSKQGSDEMPFYAGIPTGEIARALDEMGYAGVLNLETWRRPGDPDVGGVAGGTYKPPDPIS